MELKNNDLVMGSSGRIGDQLVYRQRAGKTIIAKRPRKRRTPPSALQLEVQELFSEAVLYAKSVIADDAKKAVYQAKATASHSAYILALTDFRTPPEIRKYNVSEYAGQIGDQISVRAIDDFTIQWVRLVIKDSTDDTIEEGHAILSDNGVDWIYTATVANAAVVGTKIVLTAADIPGNVATQQVIL